MLRKTLQYAAYAVSFPIRVTLAAIWAAVAVAIFLLEKTESAIDDEFRKISHVAPYPEYHGPRDD